MNPRGETDKNPRRWATRARSDRRLNPGFRVGPVQGAIMGNPYRKLVVLNVVMIALFFAVIASLGRVMTQQLERHEKSMSVASLKAMVETTHASVYAWIDNEMQLIEDYAGSAEVLQLAKTQLAVPRNREALLASEALGEWRGVIMELHGTGKSEGMFVIAPDGISVASMRDANVGTINLLVKERPEQLARAFRGEVCFAPPVVSDVPIDGDPSAASMFCLAPLKDERGEVFAVLTCRLDPRSHFSDFARGARIGETGETYFFDSRATLITESRFDEHLRASGLIAPEERGILNIEIRDPGGNLVEGFKPDRPRSEQPLTLMAKSALSGATGLNAEGYNDYRGVPVLGAWLWDEELGIGMTTEIDVAEVAQGSQLSIRIFQWVMGIMAVLAMVLSLSLLWIRGRDDNALRKKQAHVQLLLDSTAEAIYGVDLEGRCTFVNPSCLEMLGYTSAADLLEKNMHDLIHHSHEDGTSYPSEECYTCNAFRTGEDVHIVGEVLWRCDGSSFPVEYWSHHILIGKAVVGAVVTFLDITERREAERNVVEAHDTLETRVEERTRALSVAKTTALKMMHEAEEARNEAESAEEALRTHEEQFRRAIMDAPVPIMIHAEDGEVLRINHAWTNLSGYAHEDIPTIAEWVLKAYGEGTDDIRLVIDAIFERNAAAHDGEAEFATKSGQTSIWDFSSGPMGLLPDGRRVVISMATDITERRQGEHKLQKTLHDLEIFNKAAVGRELRMIELKREVNELSQGLRKSQRYDLSFSDSSGGEDDGRAET